MEICCARCCHVPYQEQQVLQSQWYPPDPGGSSPEDGNLTDVGTLDLPVGEASTDQAEPFQYQYEAHLSTPFVPNATQQRTEQETVQQSLQQLQR